MNAASGIYIGVGSNLGDREQNIRRGLEMLRSQATVVEAVSSIYQTEPWQCGPQPEYLNAAARLSSILSAAELVELMLAVERGLGRIRTGPGQPRTLDLDLLFHGCEVIETPSLTVPHPRLPVRRFVLVPLCEIAPSFVHPVLGKTVLELLSECPDRSRVEKYAPGAFCH
ncbi:MAG: 2-amino-4-hydroxy-6-hydroxymethyldihydropteridine diphosphokinase [Acidobacteriota bacterium]